MLNLQELQTVGGDACGIVQQKYSFFVVFFFRPSLRHLHLGSKKCSRASVEPSLKGALTKIWSPEILLHPSISKGARDRKKIRGQQQITTL
jgi:hypothetical protein